MKEFSPTLSKVSLYLPTDTYTRFEELYFGSSKVERMLIMHEVQKSIDIALTPLMKNIGLDPEVDIREGDAEVAYIYVASIDKKFAVPEINNDYGYGD